MISRSTLLGALAVGELGILLMAVQAVGGAPGLPGPLNAGGYVGPGAAAAGPLNRTFVTGALPHVVIDAGDVNVTVVGDGVPAVRIAETRRTWGWVTGTDPSLHADQVADGVRITTGADVAGHHHHISFGGVSQSLLVSVPMNARIEFASAGRIDASRLRSAFVAHIPDGAIHLRDHRGDVDVSTGDGTIVMTDVQGSDIAANTRDGRIYLTRVGADRLNGTSSSGRIVGVDVRAVDGTLTTRDGRVVLSFTGNSDALVSAHTGDGQVRVHGLPITEADEKHTLVRLGSGRGHFEVSTADGPITLTPGASV